MTNLITKYLIHSFSFWFKESKQHLCIYNYAELCLNNLNTNKF